ncbi:hypothetical protein OSTOST_09228 [Ostertagia ostertagi]
MKFPTLPNSFNSVSIDKEQPAILPLEYDYRYTIGSPFVSFVDLAMVNKLYECKKWCDVAEVVECKMGGFPNPRNCSKCVCPGGYGGDRCDERPEGSCGSTIKATPNWTNFTIALGDPTDPELKEDFTNCTYWIEVRCPPHVNTVGTCNDPSLEVYCPKFCNLCYTPQSTNSKIGARRSPTNK